MRRADMVPRPGAWRRRLMLGVWLVGGTVICVRAGQIQIVQGAEWRALAEAQHTTDKALVAARGSVLDRDGAAVAVSRETFRVSIAPRELRNADSAAVLLESALGLSSRAARRAVSDDRSWRVVPGTYGPRVREDLLGVRGVYLDRELRRHHPHGDLAGGVLGSVIDGEGRGGVEQAFDDILRGHSGREVIARDNVGAPIPGETYVVDEPVSGGEVVLTLDLDLQEIARQALQEAIESTEARGGDVLVTDPRSGEVLALVSIRDGRTAGLGAVHTPYEPGSTLKPFTVAGMLTHHVAALNDTVDVEDGTWTVNQRTLHDGSKIEGLLSIADALRLSSNVGIAKAAQGLTPGQQYENLRDFGFGVSTGIGLPGEVGGTLRRPDRWSLQSPASLAIGYEISVTPLQMAMAYGALANGGVLMKPYLVKEVRDPMGRVVERTEPTIVRRVASRQVAHSVSNVLVGVVEDGTGTEAQLGAFRVAGKSGTSRAYSANGGYQRGNYFSSFVGFFPADDPQLVVFVKLENPRGAYYGGAVAAPVTRATMEAALAARASVLDRAELLRGSGSELSRPAPTPVRFASQPIDPPAPPAYESRGASAAATVPLPEVAGLAPRIAARRLHALGLRVLLEGQGQIIGTAPMAGTRLLPGDTVRLRVLGRSDD